MKKILLIGIIATVCNCTPGREVQMNMIDVELVKIDTVQRYPDKYHRILTWRDPNRLEYITFEPMASPYTVGAHMKVLVRK